MDEHPTEDELLRLLEAQNEMLARDMHAFQFDQQPTMQTKRSNPSSPSAKKKTDQENLRPYKSSSVISDPETISISSTHSLLESAATDCQNGSQSLIEQDHVELWTDVIRSVDIWCRKKSKKLLDLAFLGVPDALRCVVWQSLAQYQRQYALQSRVNTASGAVDDLEMLKDHPKYPELIASSSIHERTIRLDIARTFPDHPMFQNDGLGQETLFHVIKAFSVYDQGSISSEFDSF